MNVGNTYYADHAQKNGKIAESTIDHMYTQSYYNNIEGGFNLKIFYL